LYAQAAIMSQQATDQEVPRQLWRHPDSTKTAMYDFMIKAGQTTGQKFAVSEQYFPETF
jgi:hypothetical protein